MGADREHGYIAGQRAAWSRLLALAVRELGHDTGVNGKLLELEETRAVLLSELSGLNDPREPDTHAADLARRLGKWARDGR